MKRSISFGPMTAKLASVVTFSPAGAARGHSGPTHKSMSTVADGASRVTYLDQTTDGETSGQALV